MSQKEFTRKKVQSLTLGEKLRQLREERHLRVIDLSRKIFVKAAYITALEEGRYEQLPTKVYVKGFVRSYARYFGVPEDVLLHLLEREYNVFRNINAVDHEEEVSRMPRVPRFVITPRTIVAFAGIAVLVGIGVYLFYGVDNFISSPWLIVDEPATGTVIDGDTVTIIGRTRPNSQLRINGQPILADMDGSFQESIRLSVGANTIIVESTNAFDKTTTQNILVEAHYTVTPSPEERPTTQLVITAQGTDVTVTVRDGDTMLFDGEIAADETARVEYGGDGVTVSTTNARRTLVGHDGGEAVPLGTKVAPAESVAFPFVKEEKQQTTSVDKVSL